MIARPFHAKLPGGLLCPFAFAVVVLVVACAPSADPFVISERKELREGTPSPARSGQAAPASEGASATQRQEGQARPEGGPPPDVEFIKFANWDQNRVKLTNFIAGYIIAHGLDHPVRIVDLKQDESQDALVNNDVDVVLEAPTDWAQSQTESGDVIVLGTLSSENPDSKIAVHVSMSERAPDVIEFLRSYALDGEVIGKQAARIREGRVGLKENVVGLKFLKSYEEMWTPWVASDTAELVRSAIVDGNVGLCREWAVSLADPFRVNYCTDDPTLVAGH